MRYRTDRAFRKSSMWTTYTAVCVGRLSGRKTFGESRLATTVQAVHRNQGRGVPARESWQPMRPCQAFPSRTGVELPCTHASAASRAFSDLPQTAACPAAA